MGVLVRHLEFGEAFSDQGQVALGSRGAGVSYSKYAAKAPRCVIEEPLGKDEFVSRGSGALHDRNHVCVSQPEACRRSPPGREYARGDGTNRAPRAWRFASDHSAH